MNETLTFTRQELLVIDQALFVAEEYYRDPNRRVAGMNPVDAAAAAKRLAGIDPVNRRIERFIATLRD